MTTIYISRNFTAIALLCILLAAAGCRGNSLPTVPESGNPAPIPLQGIESDRNGNGHFILAAGKLSFNKETMEPVYIPLRNAETHWNVNSLLQPPICTDCIRLHVRYFNVDEGELGIDVTLRNPTTLTAHDVRAILLPADDDPETGIRLLNYDSYTRLWDDGGDVVTNPFIAYGKENELRAFPPVSEETILFRISFADVSDLVDMPFVVDACWPSNCEEPFEMTIHQEGSLFANGSGSIDLSVFVKSWKTNCDRVFVDLTSLGGSDAVQLELDENWVEPYCRLFKGEITVSPGLDEGVYAIWVRAHTPDSQVALWTRATIRIFPGGQISDAEFGTLFTVSIPYIVWATPEITHDYLYAAADRTVMVYDVTDPYHPNFSQCIFSDAPDQFIERDGLLFVLSVFSGVYVYDTARLGYDDPVQVINPFPPYDPYKPSTFDHMEIVGDMLYIYVDPYGVPKQVCNVDISDIYSPIIYGLYDFEVSAGYPVGTTDTDIFYNENFRYELVKYEVSSTLPDCWTLVIWRLNEGDVAPDLVNEICLVSEVIWIELKHVIFHDDYFIIPIESHDDNDHAPGEQYYRGFLVYDNTNPEAPEFVHYEYSAPSCAASASNATRLGEDTYVFQGGQCNEIFDFSQLPVINFLGWLDVEGYAGNYPFIYSCDPDRHLAYYWSSEEGPFVLDVSNPTDIHIIGQFDEMVGGGSNTVLFDVEIREPGTAYCAWGYAGVVIVDVTDPDHPKNPKFVNTPDLAMDLWQRDGIVYVADRATGLVIADCTDPMHPVMTGSIPVGDESSRIDGQGNYLFVGRDLRDILIFDISSPLNPVQIGELSDPEEDILYFVVDGDRLLYRTDYYIGEFDISDISQIPSPVRANAGWYSYLPGLASEDGLVLTEYESQFSIYDLNTQPITDGPVAITDWWRGAYDIRPPYAFDYAYTGSFTTRLMIIDLSTPSDPQIPDILYTLGDGTHGSPKAFGNRVFLPTGDDGLQIIKLW